MSATIIEFSAAAHQADDNPMYAWVAYLECRRAGLEIPAWVLARLDNLVRAALKKKRPAKARALQIAAYFHALRVLNMPPVSSKEIKMDALARKVGRKFDKSMSQVYRDWNRYRHLFENVKGALVPEA